MIRYEQDINDFFSKYNIYNDGFLWCVNIYVIYLIDATFLEGGRRHWFWRKKTRSIINVLSISLEIGINFLQRISFDCHNWGCIYINFYNIVLSLKIPVYATRIYMPITFGESITCKRFELWKKEQTWTSTYIRRVAITIRRTEKIIIEQTLIDQINFHTKKLWLK